MVHVEPGPTPWRHLAALYRVLLRHDPSPTVALHHATAVGRGHSPEGGLRLIDALRAEPGLERTPTVHAARADLLERAGRPVEAVAAWETAISVCENDAQRQALARRIDPAADYVLSPSPPASNE